MQQAGLLDVLGHRATDTITKSRGVITAVCVRLHGSSDLLLECMTGTGALEQTWFAEERLTIDPLGADLIG